jgi:hypothetical protein
VPTYSNSLPMATQPTSGQDTFPHRAPGGAKRATAEVVVMNSSNIDGQAFLRSPWVPRRCHQVSAKLRCQHLRPRAPIGVNRTGFSPVHHILQLAHPGPQNPVCLPDKICRLSKPLFQGGGKAKLNKWMYKPASRQVSSVIIG